MGDSLNKITHIGMGTSVNGVFIIYIAVIDYYSKNNDNKGRY